MKSTNLKSILDKTKKKNIAIIGHMGSGKSILSKKLAQIYNSGYIDTDNEILIFEKKSINQIFTEKGENYFRKLESKIVKKCLEKKNIIISLGGGSILSKEVRKTLKKNSISIFLFTDLKILKTRLKNSKNRPLLQGSNILTTLNKLDNKRKKYYLKADIIIDNSGTINNSLNSLKSILSTING
tara:strand:+ start:3656 stop:4207 length:552 start_codon:yes stop_codon:yes gene_type:complete